MHQLIFQEYYNYARHGFTTVPDKFMKTPHEEINETALNEDGTAKKINSTTY